MSGMHTWRKIIPGGQQCPPGNGIPAWVGLRAASGRESGFTLLELLTVVIILGVLAAVVVPRYLDIADLARKTSAKGALAEGVARFNLAYVSYVKDNRHAPPDMEAMSSAAYLDLDASNRVVVGDYRLTYATRDSEVVITVEMSIGGGWQGISAQDGGELTRSVEWGS